MKVLSKPHTMTPNFSWEVDSPALKAKLRMVELPTDESRDLTGQFLFVSEDLWVPVSVVNGNIHILPGVPRLCMYRFINRRKRGIFLSILDSTSADPLIPR